MLKICFSDDVASELSIYEGTMELENGSLPILVFEAKEYGCEIGVEVKLHDGDVEDLIEVLQKKLVSLRSQMEVI